MTERRRLAVVGGGIAGLAAAYELSANSYSSPEVLLFESQDRLGGKIETRRHGELVLELGPDSFLVTKPWAQELCRELGIEGQLVGTNPDQRDVFILHRGRLEPLPDGLIMMVPTSLLSMATTPLLSLRGKARAALEPILPRRNGRKVESIEEFVSRRFGPELYAHVVEPMMSGIYAGDGSKLSIAATFPQLAEWERDHGSVTRGALQLRAARRQRTGNPKSHRSLFLAPREGLGHLVAALEEALTRQGVQLHMGHRVARLKPRPGGYEVEAAQGASTFVQGVILATPAFATAELLRPWAAELAGLLEHINYAATVTVNLAFEQEDLPERLAGYGYVIPKAEGRAALACTWTSSKFPSRAPAGISLLRVFLGRAGQEGLVGLDDDALTDLARQEIRETLGIHENPFFRVVKRWPRAMPQYNIGHLNLVEQIRLTASRLPGLELAGAAYGGIGIPDCIHSGRQAARALLSCQT